MVFAYMLYEEDWRVIEICPLLFTLERGEFRLGQVCGDVKH